MFLFFYVFNFNAIARESCYAKYEGMDKNSVSHLIIPKDKDLSEMYFECGVDDPKDPHVVCLSGRRIAVLGKATIAGQNVENLYVQCQKVNGGFKWVKQETVAPCSKQFIDSKSTQGLNPDDYFFNNRENSISLFVSSADRLNAFRTVPVEKDEKICIAYMCKPDFVLYDDKCTYKSDVPERIMSIRAGNICSVDDLKKYEHATSGEYQSDKNIKCIVTECENGYEPDEKGEKCIKISDADTGSANTGASQSGVGETNENPSPAFLQTMSELEEINKALDEVMKRLQEEKQVKNDNVT